MNGALAIARYEVGRRWGVWLVAIALGLAPLFFVETDHDLVELLVAGGAVLSWVIAFTTGMSILGKPLHDGTLSFYFTRPLKAHAVASGKVLGGLTVVLGMEVLILYPLYDEGLVEANAKLLFVGGMAVLFLAAGFVVGILARSRSRWFAVDAVGCLLAALVSVALLSTVNDRKSFAARNQDYDTAAALFGRVDTLLRALVVGAVIVVIGAVIVAIARGRTDRVRVHRVLSVTLWPALIATSLVGVVVARWGL